MFPLICHTSCTSLGNIVTLLACIVQRLVSSINLIKYNSAASCKAKMAPACMRWKACSFWRISLTNLRKGIFGIKSSVLFWYFLISFRVWVPSLNHLLWDGLTAAQGWIFSRCFTPMQGVFPLLSFLPAFFATTFSECDGSITGIPIIVLFLNGSFIQVILCNEKYLE